MSEVLEFPIRTTKFAHKVAVKERLLSRKTQYQQIDIVDTYAFGRMLLLDGHVQLSELDERAYHEALVQVPMLTLKEARRALVVGGGDGGVLRELCKHGSLREIEMVEIDEGVVAACKEFLPNVSAGAFEDARVSLHIQDAFGFLKNTKGDYDIIVLDVTDIYEDEEGGLSESLFTQEFYEDCRSALTEEGFLVAQADNLLFCPRSFDASKARLQTVFTKSGDYFALVPSFGGYSGFVWGSKSARIRGSLMNQHEIELSYLNETTYALGMSALPFTY